MEVFLQESNEDIVRFFVLFFVDVETLRAVARRMSTDSWSSAALVSTMSATALPSSLLASDRLTLL